MTREICSGLVLAALFVAPLQSAVATVGTSCTYNPTTRVVTVDHSPGPSEGDTSLLREGNAIHLAIGGSTTPCGSATVTNTDTISLEGVNDPDGWRLRVLLHDYAPGFTNEPGNSDEIEFRVDFDGPFDGLGFHATADSMVTRVVLGGAQINLNPRETQGIDADVMVTGIEAGVGFAFAGGVSRRVDGRGGAGTPATAFQISLGASGGTAPDIFVGGSSDDGLSGGRGGDVLWGKRGSDFITGGRGPDRMVGGKGGDEIEDDGKGPDVLRGGLGRDGLYGQVNNDKLWGGPGRDFLGGHQGNDYLNGGPGFDECWPGAGSDIVVACEKIGP
jgi:Ca2+-binding RTX toxin-like protein